MKKILLLIALTLLAISTANALEPLKVAIFKTGGAANVQVVLNDYIGGTASAIYTGPTVPLTPNSSGVIIINIVNNTAATDWADITAAQVNSHYILDVLVGGTLYAQYRLDQQIINQSQGGVLDTDGNLTPSESGTASVGSDDKRWDGLYVTGNTLHVGPIDGELNNDELAFSYNETTNTATMTVAGASALTATTAGVTIPGTLTATGNTTVGGDVTIAGGLVANPSGANKDFIFGDDDLDWTGGVDHKMYFDYDKGAFRVGTVNTNKWNAGGNVGNNSVAMGFNTTASGSASTAMGSNTTASGNLSTAMGSSTEASSSTSTAMGNGTIASGTNSTAMGANTTASGINSTSMGWNSVASGHSSIAMSNGTIANEEYSVAMGRFNDASMSNELLTIGNGTGSSSRSNAFEVYMNGDVVIPTLSSGGTQNLQVDNTGKLVASTIISSPFTESGNKVYRNDPDDDFIFGDDDFMHDSPVNIDENKFFFDKSKGAFRVGTISNVNWDDVNVGVGSFATGKSTLASGEGAIALGPFHDASGQFSVAIGYASYATKKFSFAIGVNANAHGESSYSFGTGSAAMADYSTAIGINSAAVAEYGTAIGIGSKAEGEYSTAIGLWTKAMSYGETVVGTFNTNYTPDNDVAFDVDDRHFVIGNGTADGSRSDALIIYKSGNVEIPSLSSGGTQNLQVDNTGKLVAGGGTVTTNTTINGDGATTALGINLASANTWTGVQTLPATSAQGNALISSINSGTTTINAARVSGGGGGTLAYTEVTANTTLNTENRVVFITGAYTVTLPASPATGQILHFYSESATAEIDSQTIEVRDDGIDYTGSAPFSDYTSGLNVSLFYNGSKWLIISK